MKIFESVDWDSDVLPAWQRASNNAPRPNSDVWMKLPSNVAWHAAEVETCDISSIFVIGSSDWQNVFGSYRLQQISEFDFSTEDDEYRHKSRIVGMQKAILQGVKFEPIIIVAPGHNGPFVTIDGNHRLVALHILKLLAGSRIYIGLNKNIEQTFSWFNSSRGS